MGITNVAVIERGWLGGGNTGRNTTIVRSNYLWDRICKPLRACLESFGKSSVPRAELQCDVLPERRLQPRAHANQHDLREIEPAGQCEPA